MRASTVARIVVAGLAIATITAPTMVSSVSAPDSPPVYLVDDGGGSTSSPPPYNPTPSGGEDGNGNGGTDGGNSGEGDPSAPNSGDGESQTPDDEAGKDEGIPVAAQAGLSLGVIGLAALALIPGRRPPAWMRR